MNVADFRNLIKNNQLHGSYLFYGDEEYMKQFCLNAVREAIIQPSDVFNHTKITEENYSLQFLAASVEALPVFADKKLIEIHSLDINSMKESDLEDFIGVLKMLNDYEFNVIIIYMSADSFDAGTEKYPSKLLTTLSKSITPVAFDFETPVKLVKWIQQHFKANLIVIEPDVCNHLIKNTGLSMFRLKSEIDKLSAYLLSHGRNNVSVDDIDNIVVHVKTIDPFDFANAMLDNNMEKVFYILSEMKKNKERPEIILSQISRVYGDLCMIRSLHESGMSAKLISSKLKMHEYRVSLYLKNTMKRSLDGLRNAVESCYDADVKIKSTALDNYAVLDKLVVEISQIS